MSRLSEWWAAKRPVVQTASEVTTLKAKAAGYEAAYQKAPWHMSAQHLLSELDPQMISWLRRLQQNDVLVSPFGSSGTPEEKDRLQLVQWARLWAIRDPIIGATTKLWTDYGFGRAVSLHVVADDAEESPEQKVWDAFFKHPKNRALLGERSIHNLSNRLLSDGELFFVMWRNTLNGACILRRFPTEEVTERVTLPDDSETVLYYKRVWMEGSQQNERYYPDWLASEDDLSKANLPVTADVASEQDGLSPVVLHVALEGIDWRGWPLCTATEPWAKAYKQFSTDRAAVARNAAAVLEEYNVKGGPRMVDIVKRGLQSSLNSSTSDYETNPPPGAGSYRVQNEAVTTKRMSMATGAGDAAQDSMLLLGQAAAGSRVTTMMLGRTDMTQNRAIAQEAMKPTLRAWARYQMIWRSVFEDFYTIVCDSAARWGNATDGGLKLSSDYETDIVVSLGSPIDSDFALMIDAISVLWEKGIVSEKLLSLIVMQQPEMGLTQDVIEATLEAMYPEGEGMPDEEPEEEPDEEPEEESELLAEVLGIRAMMDMLAIRRDADGQAD